MNRQAAGLVGQNGGVISQGDNTVLSDPTLSQGKLVKFSVAETGHNSRAWSD